MNRRSFLAALCAAPFVPAAAKEATAEVNPSWAAEPVPNGFAAINGVNSIDLGNVDISNAHFGTLVVRESNIAPEFSVESRRDGMHIVYAEKFGIPPVQIAR
jgi:hypothetical protein